MQALEVKIFNPKSKKKRIISKEVTDFKKDYASIIEAMKKLAIEKEAYAIAAPQLGIMERFILIMTIEEVKELHSKNIKYNINSYFNPVITKMEGFQYFFEACLSVYQAIGKVARPYYIEIEAYDINGHKIHKTASGFEAIVLCHEIDHLDGIEYTDRAEIMYYNVLPEEKIEIRKRNPHQILRKKEAFKYIKTKQRVLKYKRSDIKMFKKSFTKEEALAIANKLKIDFKNNKFDINQFIMGLNIELEHGKRDRFTNVTNDDFLMTGKIALAHLNEFPDYYTRLEKLEEEAKAYWKSN